MYIPTGRRSSVSSPVHQCGQHTARHHNCSNLLSQVIIYSFEHGTCTQKKLPVIGHTRCIRWSVTILLSFRKSAKNIFNKELHLNCLNNALTKYRTDEEERMFSTWEDLIKISLYGRKGKGGNNFISPDVTLA